MDAVSTAAGAPSSKLKRSITRLLFRSSRKLPHGGSPNVNISDHSIDGSSLLSQSAEVDKSEGGEDSNKKLQAIRAREEMESVLAELFASLSAIKAAYAQLQIAQSPYDPETIQAADLALVSELKHISQVKHSYLKEHIVHGSSFTALSTQQQLSDDARLMAAEIQERKNLLKTYKITTHKLENDLQRRTSDIATLRARLQQVEEQNRALEARLYPKCSLSVLDDLHLSGLNATHFLVLLRYAIKSIKSFVKLMVGHMVASDWNLDAAAACIEPDVVHEHKTFAFESYVCRALFSGFQDSNFGLWRNEEEYSGDRRRFFEEFQQLKHAKGKQLLGRRVVDDHGFGRFFRAKYEAVVNPQMESSLFGKAEQRNQVSVAFADMARRVWLLHRLFFSFDAGMTAEVFEVGRGSRFSEVYMESVTASEKATIVAFTVVPGFKLGKTVIQCRVYLVDRFRQHESLDSNQCG